MSTINQYLAIVEKMLSADFPGSIELRKQLIQARLAPIPDEPHSMHIIHNSENHPARVTMSVPVEAKGADSDGTGIVVLLHVHYGMLHELEVYRVDGQPIWRLPDADALTITTRAD